MLRSSDTFRRSTNSKRLAPDLNSFNPNDYQIQLNYQLIQTSSYNKFPSMMIPIKQALMEPNCISPNK